jgi:O-antigen ligase
MLALAVFAAGWCIFPIQQKKDGSVLEASFSSKVLRVFFIIFSFSILLNVIPDSIRERLGTLLSIGSDYNVSTSSNLSRTLIWSRDIIAVVKRPIGFGLGSAYVVDGLNGGAYMTAHNSLVQVLVELGLAGLIVYIAIYFSAFSRVRAAGARADKNSTPDPYGPLLARALRTALVCNFVAGFFLSQGYSPVFWCLIALCIAFEKVTALRHEGPSYAKRSKVFK